MPLSNERDELASSARRLLDRASSSQAVREVLEGPTGHDPELWRQMVELGWVGIHVPAELGGAGAGYIDLAVVLHELGRHVTPSPFLASAVLATGALLGADNGDLRSEMLPQLVAGERIGTAALSSTAGSSEIAALSAHWEHDGAGIALRGAAAFVPDADVADVVVVAATGQDRTPVLALVETSAPGVGIEAMATIDATRRLFSVSLDDVAVPQSRMLCDPGPAAGAAIDHLVVLGAIAVAADGVGVAEQVMQATGRYAQERVQFGRPIGSFQAVKHHCANMVIAVECSRAAVRAAVDALDDAGAGAGVALAAAVATSYAGPACSQVCALGVQVHGGIGFTWEHDSHLYLKRAKLDEAWFGTPAWHRRRLAGAVFPAPSSPSSPAASSPVMDTVAMAPVGT